jgi:putative ABC transport system permease protein
VVINETVARTYWPNRDPLGKHITLSAIGGRPEQTLEIIGVVKDSKYRSLTETPQATMFLPLWQHFRPDLALHLRSAGDTKSIVAAVRREVQALDANLPLFNVKTLAEQRNNSLATERMTAMLLTAFGGLALLLAATGIYGVMAYAVNQRTHEIGIRMALGAQARDILRMVLQEGSALLAAGFALGIAGAVAATHLLWSFLYGVDTTDPVTIAGVVVLLTLVALVACYVPARRATKVDPMVALRYE